MPSTEHFASQIPRDSTIVNFYDQQELNFWAERFAVSVDEIRDAVKLVGPRFKDVEFFFSQNSLALDFKNGDRVRKGHTIFTITGTLGNQCLSAVDDKGKPTTLDIREITKCVDTSSIACRSPSGA